MAWYWKVLYLFWCMAGTAGNQAALRGAFEPHCQHLKALLPDLLRSRCVPPLEKLRAVLFSLDPDAAYRLAAAWGRAAGGKKPKK